MRRTILGVEFLTPDPVVADVVHRHRVELGLAREFANWEDEPAPIYDQLQRERGVA